MGYAPFKMKYKNLEEVVEQLNSAVVAHGKQAKTIKKHINEMEGSKESPATFKGANSSNSKCWPGKKKVGTKPSPTRPGVTVNDCV